jgi:hypothetical protein
MYLPGAKNTDSILQNKFRSFFNIHFSFHYKKIDALGMSSSMDIFLVKIHVNLAIYYYVQTTCIYIKGTLHYGLQLHRTLVTDLVAYSNAD